MPGKTGMTGRNLGGARPGAGRPRSRYVFRPGEMVALGIYDANGNMQRLDYCNVEAQTDGVICLTRSDGWQYKLGGLPAAEADHAPD